MTKAKQLLEGVLKKDRRSLSQLISLLETSPSVSKILSLDSISTNFNGRVIGITGPPGVGKSTFTSKFIDTCGITSSIGVLAIDPTSPISGGALLGDRVRMTNHTTSQNIYIRSLSSKGISGGLTPIAYDVIQLYKLFGMKTIIVESVGVGQSEWDTQLLCDITILLLFPNMGDSIQLLKAGIMELADIYCINHADRFPTEHLVHELEHLVSDSQPIFSISSHTGEGFLELHEHLNKPLATAKRVKIPIATQIARWLSIELEQSGDIIDVFKKSHNDSPKKIAARIIDAIKALK